MIIEPHTAPAKPGEMFYVTGQVSGFSDPLLKVYMNADAVAVPLPPTGALLALGLVGLGCSRPKRIDPS